MARTETFRLAKWQDLKVGDFIGRLRVGGISGNCIDCNWESQGRLYSRRLDEDLLSMLLQEIEVTRTLPEPTRAEQIEEAARDFVRIWSDDPVFKSSESYMRMVDALSLPTTEQIEEAKK